MNDTKLNSKPLFYVLICLTKAPNFAINYLNSVNFIWRASCHLKTCAITSSLIKSSVI